MGRSRTSDVVWAEPSRHVPDLGRLCRQDPEGRQARRPPCPAADKVRAARQSQDRQGARHHGPALDPRPRRRGHRMKPVGLFLALCAAIPALAQDATRPPLVGVLSVNTAANNEPPATALRDALAALGDIDGKSIRLDFRLAEGDAGRFPELAEALVRDNPSVIVAYGPPAVKAAQHATKTIPIVASANDLVASGFIQSMARPGGNITGVSLLVPELDAKRLEVLHEILPSARRFGLLIETATRAPAVMQPVVDTARALGVAIQNVEVGNPADFPRAVVSFRVGGVDAVNILSSALLFFSRRELGTLLLANKLPAICEWRKWR